MAKKKEGEDLVKKAHAMTGRRPARPKPKVRVIESGTNFGDFRGTYDCLICHCKFEVLKNDDVYEKKVPLQVGDEIQTVKLRAHKCPGCEGDVILNYPQERD